MNVPVSLLSLFSSQLRRTWLFTPSKITHGDSVSFTRWFSWRYTFASPLLSQPLLLSLSPVFSFWDCRLRDDKSPLSHSLCLILFEPFLKSRYLFIDFVRFLLCLAATWVSFSLGKNTEGNELLLGRVSNSSGGGLTKIFMIVSLFTGNFFLLSVIGKFELLGFSILNAKILDCSRLGEGWSWSLERFIRGSLTFSENVVVSLRSYNVVVSVEERERSVSFSLRCGGLHNWKILLGLAKQAFHIWRHSLFANNKKKKTRQRKPGATTLINGKTMLYLGDLQSVEV